MGDVMTDARRPGIYGSKTIYGKTFGFLGYGAVSVSARAGRIKT